MSTPNDGGPAFPIVSDDLCATGMTLRDYFAAKALQGILASTEAAQGHKIHVQNVAAGCYTIADAMLAERVKIKEEQS